MGQSAANSIRRLRASHTWHKCNEHDCIVCNGGLGWCTVCGGAEADLPRDCPGTRMTEEQKISVRNEDLDFYRGRWWRSAEADDDFGLREIEERVNIWLRDCVGHEVADDLAERNHRFCEEALELLQACGYTRAQIDAMADVVYSKPPSSNQGGECADVIICLVQLARARNIDLVKMVREGIARNWANSDKIREKNRTKPIRSGTLR